MIQNVVGDSATTFGELLPTQSQADTGTLPEEGRVKGFVEGTSSLSYEDYRNATNGFKDSCGKGGEGEVFLGMVCPL